LAGFFATTFLVAVFAMFGCSLWLRVEAEIVSEVVAGAAIFPAWVQGGPVLRTGPDAL
jgi:hypothetical protein